MCVRSLTSCNAMCTANAACMHRALAGMRRGAHTLPLLLVTRAHAAAAKCTSASPQALASGITLRPQTRGGGDGYRSQGARCHIHTWLWMFVNMHVGARVWGRAHRGGEGRRGAAGMPEGCGVWETASTPRPLQRAAPVTCRQKVCLKHAQAQAVPSRAEAHDIMQPRGS